jgi:hypothetical protein
MRDYVTNFFSCTECAQNFAKESLDMDKELKYANSSILWLWKTHNSVNKRLAGDATEDPAHPKAQFPRFADCPPCYRRDGSGNWDEPQLLKYLVERYSKDILRLDVPPTRAVKANEGRESLASGKVPFYDHSERQKQTEDNGVSIKGWSYSLLNRTDISLCLFLYVVSAGLILSLFFIMKYRGRRKRYSNKLSNHYP